MGWRLIVPAVGAGLLGSAAFWWVTMQYLCADCDSTVCEWGGACLAGWGIPLAMMLIAVSFLVPFRLVEERWPWVRRKRDGG